MGNTEPLSWCGCNLEDQEGVSANPEIAGAGNVRIYLIKREGRSPTLILSDSANVGLFGLGAMREGVPAGSGSYLQLRGASARLRNALALVQTTGGTPNGEPLLSEALAGQPVRTIVWPDSLGLYGRGELDDNLME